MYTYMYIYIYIYVYIYIERERDRDGERERETLRLLVVYYILTYKHMTVLRGETGRRRRPASVLKRACASSLQLSVTLPDSNRFRRIPGPCSS